MINNRTKDDLEFSKYYKDTENVDKKSTEPNKQISKKRDYNHSTRRTTSHHTKNPSYIKKELEVKIPPMAEDTIRIIPLGGVEEVGKNMTVVEYKDDIIVFDAGFQFVGEDDAPGIDYILPNTKYLEERRDKIKALVITHGHLDHIGGIPFLIEKLGNPPIYTRNLTSIMIKKRMSEFPHVKMPEIKEVKPDEKITLGGLALKFFAVTHSIPDSMGISVETPYGNIVITGDLKLDHIDEDPTDAEKKVWGEIGKDKNIFFIADSTNVSNPGWSKTEKSIHKTLEKLIRDTPGRIIIGTFASQFERMVKIIEIGEKYGKKIILDGRSIKTNLEIAQLAGILKPKKGTIVPVEEITQYPPEKTLILATGAQGEEFASLMRISTKKHKYIKMTDRDTVILSSSIIPGNEVSVQKLKDNIYRNDTKIIHYKVSDVHSTGHGNAGELAWINKQVNPRFFMPAYGHHFMLKIHREVAMSIGMKKEDVVVPDNGTIIELRENGESMVVLKEKAPSNIIMVDGLSIGDVQEAVIKDRQALAQDGIFVIIATIDLSKGKLKKSPDIISRGFVYLRESQDLLHQTRRLIKATAEDTVGGMHPVDFDLVKKEISHKVNKFLFRKTNKKPMVITVVLGV